MLRNKIYNIINTASIGNADGPPTLNKFEDTYFSVYTGRNGF